MPDDERLHVGFSLTEQDVYQFYVYHVLHEPSMRAVLLLAVLFVFGFTAALFVKHGFAASLVAGLLAVIGFVLLYRALLRRKARQADRMMIGCLGEHQMGISPDGLFESSPNGEGSRRWEAIERVVGMSTGLCFYLGKGFGVIIPRRAFASPEAAATFLRAAQRWHAEAKAAPLA
jgi:hypothetical protein